MVHDSPVAGYYGIFEIDEHTGLWTPLFTAPNTIMISWGQIASQCIGLGNPAYKISAMYLEYQNVGAPGDTVTVPSYVCTDPISYFDSLPGATDILRVPMVANPVISIVAGDEAYFTPPAGNSATFYAQSAGTVGVHGVPFTDVDNSKLYGVSLVATPLWSDRTQDVLYSRSYFSTGNQKLKLPNSQIGVAWIENWLRPC